MAKGSRIKQLVLAILVLGFLAAGACSSADIVSPTGNSSAADAQSQVIKQWAGKGPLTTKPFTIESESWLIEWEHVPSQLKGSSVGSLQIIVWGEEGSSSPVDVAANSMVEESGTSRIDEAGTFYLMINATNTRWSVRIMEAE
ncbi:hypothetical protein ACFLVG_02450 [Chloroflexota bacterium]